MTRIIVKTLAALAVLLITASHLSAAEVVTYYHNDHLGSPIAATDSSAQVVWQQAYDPWGEKLVTNSDERGYTGNWADGETGLADHKARWYASSIGRFSAIDPVKWNSDDIHSFNRYAYARNNPYGYVDKDGRSAVSTFEQRLFLAGVSSQLDSPAPGPGDVVGIGIAVYATGELIVNALSESADESPGLPDDLVGVQDSKSRRRGKRHVSGPLAPENGGEGNAEDDFEVLTGGVSRPAPDNYPEGTRIGDNGIIFRPGNDSGKPRIDIPAKGERPHETLHYSD